jgi:hypothetical protein
LARSTLLFSYSGLLTAFGLCSRNAYSFPATIHAVYGMALGCRGQSSRAPFSSSLCLHANHHAPSLVREMTRRNVLKDQRMCWANGPSNGRSERAVPRRTTSLGLEQGHPKPLSVVAVMPRAPLGNDSGDCGRGRCRKKLIPHVQPRFVVDKTVTNRTRETETPLFLTGTT